MERGVLCAGNVRTNCKHLPKQYLAADNYIKLGDVSYFQAEKLIFIKWMDTKSVHIISNYLGAYPLYEVKCQKKILKKTTASCPVVV